MGPGFMAIVAAILPLITVAGLGLAFAGPTLGGQNNVTFLLLLKFCVVAITMSENEAWPTPDNSPLRGDAEATPRRSHKESAVINQ